LRIGFGHISHMARDSEITERHSALPPEPGPPPSDPRPPRLLADDVWPWLALLGILAVAGLLVWLFVFRDRGGHGPTVPAVVGLRQQQAVVKVTGAGFNARVIIGPSAKPRTIVVSQSPGGGVQLAHGQTVTLHVSNGRALSTTTAATTTASTTTAATTQTTQTTQATVGVPNVVGQDAASGAGQIEAAGFVAETDPVSGSGAPGSVTGQDPSAGSQAAAGSVVRLSVVTGSNRPPVQVPDVVGHPAAAARAALLDAKLTAKTVYKKGTAKQTGVVLAESPSGSLPAYSQVTLTVGS
jgi:beta-lactam-binding protein with PASTA domain